MLDAGDCGSFNPLLLECLHEIEHRLVQELKVDFIADPASKRRAPRGGGTL